MNDNNNCRIKIKYPNGFEIEIEGSKDFVLKQKNELLSEASLSKEENLEKILTRKKSIEKLIDIQNNIPYIKIRVPDLDIQLATLILLTAYKDLYNEDSVSAITLSKSLKLSGYIPKRIDRALTGLIKEKKIISIGTKRKRIYKITDKGLTTSSIKIHNLTAEKPKQQ
jgi:hypothetical protein